MLEHAGLVRLRPRGGYLLPAWLLATGAVILSFVYGALYIALEGNPVVVVLATLPFAILLLGTNTATAVYVVIGLALVADGELTPWLRIYRGVSDLSGQSLRWLILSPLELLLLLAVLGHVVRAMRARQVPFRAGPYLWPMVPFFSFVTLGLVYGFLKHGDMRIALWEMRAMVYVPVLYLLFFNGIKTKVQLHTVAWVVLLSIAVDAFLGAWTYLVLMKGDLRGLGAITDHQQGVVFNALFLIAVAYVLYGGPRKQKWLSLIMVPPAVITYVATDRRSAYVSLAVGIVALLALAYRDRKRTVVTVGLVGLVLFAVYAGAFWRSSSVLAKPLRGLSSVAAQPGDQEYLSNLYRVQEKWDIATTIRHNPVFGVGFGNPFEMMIYLTFFDSALREYLTHNSITWIWLKMGAGGFIVFLASLGLLVAHLTQRYRRVADGSLKPFLATGLLFVVMYMIYSYVDQGWDYKGMVFIGMVLGAYAVVEREAKQGDPESAETGGAPSSPGGQATAPERRRDRSLREDC